MPADFKDTAKPKKFQLVKTLFPQNRKDFSPGDAAHGGAKVRNMLTQRHKGTEAQREEGKVLNREALRLVLANRKAAGGKFLQGGLPPCTPECGPRCPAAPCPFSEGFSPGFPPQLNRRPRRRSGIPLGLPDLSLETRGGQAGHPARCSGRTG